MTTNKILNLFSPKEIGIEVNPVPPIWLMRQAGRYLPEYRKLRSEAGSFLNLCQNAELATEITMQPILRFDFDAAIVFSDILLVPQALGQKLWFVEGEGPRLQPITNKNDLLKLDKQDFLKNLTPTLKTLTRLKQELPRDKSLIGFCGAPWTLATYILAGSGGKHLQTIDFCEKNPEFFGELLALLTTASIDYLCAQAEAGADILQIFDSWAGAVPPKYFVQWCIEPMREIILGVKKNNKNINPPIIAFPRAMDFNLFPVNDYITSTGCDGLSLDTDAPLQEIIAATDNNIVLQGNLCPKTLVNGGKELAEAIDYILEISKNRKFIFNLGHGILPQTPLENVEFLLNRVRAI